VLAGPSNTIHLDWRQITDVGDPPLSNSRIKKKTFNAAGFKAEILVYFESEQAEANNQGTLVCLYQGVWHEIIPHKSTRSITLGGIRRDIHQFDEPSFTPESLETLTTYREAVQATNAEFQESSESSTATGNSTAEESSTEEDQTNKAIRAAPFSRQVSIMTTQTITKNTTRQQSNPPSGRASPRPPSPPTPCDPQDIMDALNAAMRRMNAGGPGGPGGPPGGPGGPGGPPGGPLAQQHGYIPNPVPQAIDAKIIGAIPEKFTGDRTKAQQFIDAVKGYLRANYDVPGFGSPKKKVAFMLTLMEGEDVASWKRDMGNWI